MEEHLEAGHQAYALRDYETAAEKYALASEVSAEKYGLAGIENADVLFFYGRALYHCAVRKSDVLGEGAGPGPGEKSKELISEAALANSPKKQRTLFQFEGDADDSGDENEEPEVEEEEDDFQNAWDVLDLARVLLEKRLDSPDGSRKDRERLAEVYDLLGEVSLESENFPQAVKDLTSSLNIKTELYEKHSTLLSEAHFKLALALEFSGAQNARDKAADQIQLAITSCELRIEQEQETSGVKGKDKEGKEITEARELIKELQQRLNELKTPTKAEDTLQQVLGESADEVRKRIVSAMTGAQDVNSLVRKKPKHEEEAKHEEATNGNGEPPSKKVKIEEVPDSSA